MREAVLEDAHRIVLRDVDAAIPHNGEALLAVQRVGICGSDVHAFRGEHPFIHPPIVLGHEFSAQVVSAPADSGFMPGDRVTVEPSLVCGHCPNCKSGRYNICDHLKVVGCQSRGAMAELIAVPTEKLVRLPDAVSWDDACLVEPLAVGVHAIRRALLAPCESVLILGAGTIGLMCLAAARALGAGTVMVADPLEWRRDIALAAGADEVCADPSTCTNTSPLDPRPDVIFECTGHGSAASQAVRLSRKGGRVVIVGVHAKPEPIDVGLIQDWELDVLGTLMYTRQDFEEALNLIAERRVPTDLIVTHRMRLTHVADAFSALGDPDERALKALLTVA